MMVWRSEKVLVCVAMGLCVWPMNKITKERIHNCLTLKLTRHLQHFEIENKNEKLDVVGPRR